MMKTDAERWLAALAHAVVLLLGFGTAVPVLVWGRQRQSSPASSEQALQALVWQSLLPIFYQLLLLVWGMGVLVWALFAPAKEEMLLISLGALALLMGLGTFFYLGVGVLAALFCLAGKPFRYPFFGRVLAHALANDPPGGNGFGQTEERVAAAMAHAGIFVPLIGMAVPLCTLLVARQGSPRLRFQSGQALGLQVVFNVLNMVFSAFASVLFVPLLLIAFGMQGSPVTDVTSAATFVLLLLILALLLLAMAATLLLPLLVVFAFIASIQTLRGRDYVYPLLGGWVRRRLGDSFVERPV
jgi:uncharacterized Tic20 family protein